MAGGTGVAICWDGTRLSQQVGHPVGKRGLLCQQSPQCLCAAILIAFLGHNVNAHGIPILYTYSYNLLAYRPVNREVYTKGRTPMSAAARVRGANNTRREGSGRSKNTVRVFEHTHATLRNLADETGEPMQEVIAEAVEAFRRRRILELTNAAYAAMRSDPALWQEELDEREAWDVTLRDGLEDK